MLCLLAGEGLTCRGWYSFFIMHGGAAAFVAFWGLQS